MANNYIIYKIFFFAFSKTFTFHTDKTYILQTLHLKYRSFLDCKSLNIKMNENVKKE